MSKILQGVVCLLLGVLISIPKTIVAQFAVPSDSSFYTLQDSFYQYYQDDSTEGGMYNKMRRATMIWGPRLAPDGRMSRANQAMLAYTRAYMNIPPLGGGNSQTTPVILPSAYPASITWGELGHLSPLVGTGSEQAKGMGQIQRLAFHPAYNGSSNQIIYAGAHYGGLYRSDNGGQQWYNYQTDRGLPMTSVGDVAASANYVFVCTGNGDHASASFGANGQYAPIRGNLNNFSPLHTQGVYRNTHNNPTSQWQSLHGNQVDLLVGPPANNLFEVFEQGGTMRRIVVHPTNENILLIATSQGIFRTGNGGNTWQQVLVGAPNGIGGYHWETAWRGVEFHPTNPNIVYASAKDVYKSTDGGLTWASMTNGQGLQQGTKRTNIAVTPANPDRLYAYAVGWNGYVFVHEQGIWTFKGNNTRTNENPDWLDIAVSPVHQDVVHVTGLRSEANYNFDVAGVVSFGGTGGPIHDDVHFLGYPPNGDTVLFAGTHGGVSRCTTSAVGATVWENLYTGLGVTMIYSFDDWAGADSLLMTANQDIGINYSYDLGNSWYTRSIGDGYGIRINDQTGMAYLRGNDYAGVRQLYPNFGFPANQSAAAAVVNGLPYDAHLLNTNGIGAHLPNTFPGVNHPKNERFYLGMSELYWRKKDFFAAGTVPFYTILDTILVDGPAYDNQGNLLYAGAGTTCSAQGGRPIGVFLSLYAQGTVPGTKSDTFCEVTRTIYDGAQAYDELWGIQSELKQYQSRKDNRRILEMAFSEDEATNYTYLVTLGDFGHRRCDLYFNDKDAMGCDTCFIPKTANLPYDSTINSHITKDPNPITGIAVDPLDGNRVWVTFSGYSKQLKVWYSENAGDSWTSWDDSTNSLAHLNLPINNIVYQRGTKDRLYIATDAGIYVREGQGAWLRYGESFPNVRVTELKINYCLGKLRASTFGRGMWESEVLPTERTIAYRSFRTVSTNETWSANKHLARDLRIKAGASLHLQNMTLNMPKGGLIVVEPGGQLLVDSSTITNLCGQTWQGIEVWGNTSLEQHPNTNQGELLVINSKIEHAKEAVSPWQVGNFPRPDGTGGTGGIVRAINSTFSNNWRSVGFMRYQSPSSTYPEASNFINCTFTVDEENRQGFLGHVSAWDVAQLSFEGCVFQDNRLQKKGDAFGIYSLSASVQLTAQPPSPFNIRFKRNTFEGLARAIELGSDPTRFSSVVDQCDFDANSRGVIVRADAGVKIIRNNFELGGYNNTPEYGIGLLRQGDFIVQQNTFTKSAQAAGLDVSIGLWVEDTKSGYNQIRNNSFVGIPLANLVHGDNGEDPNFFGSGLQYLCNGHTANAYDITLNQSGQLIIGSSIAPNQGENLQPAKNSFSYPLDGNYFGDWHLWNDGSGLDKVLYWLPPNASQVEEPTDTFKVRVEESSFTGNPAFCDDQYTNPYVFKPQEESSIATLSSLKDKYYQSWANYQNLVEMGSTNTDKGQIAAVGQQVSYYANEIVFYYKNDTTTTHWDSIGVWLGKNPGLMAQYDLVEHYWKQGFYTTAFEQLDYIQDNFELIGVVYENHSAYHRLKNILLTAYEENRNEALLEVEEVDQLRAIADNNYGFAAVYAANIVNFFYNYEYQYTPTLPSVLEAEKSWKVEETSLSNLVIYPNPSHTWVEVEYQLPKDREEGLLRITSTNGQILQEIAVRQSNSKVTLTTRNWTTGIYFVALYSKEELIEQTTLVVKN
ncbi:MAG: T9SS type A sorting domain-containing protein [Aureispira sp.]